MQYCATHGVLLTVQDGRYVCPVCEAELEKLFMKNKIKLFNIGVAACLFLASLAMVSGCKAPNLEPGGAYNVVTTNAVTGAVTSTPDFAFLAVDSAFDLAEQNVDRIFLYEQNNRASLWAISPEIKHALDRCRPIASSIVLRYKSARAAYIAKHSPEGLSTLNGLLSEIQTIQSTVQAAAPQPK